MKCVIARQAEAERERQVVVIKSEGELIAARNLEKALQSMSNRALYLRTLSSPEDISYDQSNTIMFAISTDLVKGKIMGLTAFAGANKTAKEQPSEQKSERKR